MSPLELLRVARERLASPEGWTREVYARNASGERVPFSSPDACSFCVRGAVLVVSKGVGVLTYSNTIAALLKALPSPWRETELMSDFNDAPTTTRADVLALFDRAIAALESK